MAGSSIQWTGRIGLDACAHRGGRPACRPGRGRRWRRSCWPPRRTGRRSLRALSKARRPAWVLVGVRPAGCCRRTSRAHPGLSCCRRRSRRPGRPAGSRRTAPGRSRCPPAPACRFSPARRGRRAARVGSPTRRCSPPRRRTPARSSKRQKNFTRVVRRRRSGLLLHCGQDSSVARHPHACRPAGAALGLTASYRRPRGARRGGRANRNVAAARAHAREGGRARTVARSTGSGLRLSNRRERRGARAPHRSRWASGLEQRAVNDLGDLAARRVVVLAEVGPVTRVRRARPGRRNCSR